MLKRIICGLLACLMLVSLVACNNSEVPNEPSNEPAVTEPEATQPAETKPAETQPAETQPAETQPAETQPAETKPAETKPVETQPTQTQPSFGDDDNWGDDPWDDDGDWSDNEDWDDEGDWGDDETWEDEGDDPDLTDPDEDTKPGDATQGSGNDEGYTDVLGRPLEEDEILRVDRTNYGGTEIKILQKDTSEDEMFAARKIGELINDAVYDRNDYVEKYLGVKLKYESAPASVNDYTQFKTKVDAAVRSGYDMYHIISNYSYNAPTLIQEGAFLDYNGIAKEDNFLDFSKRWWNDSFATETVINEKLYMLTGDITTTMIDWAEVMFVNNDMLDTYIGMSSDELLQMVYDFEWTYETFLQYVHAVGKGAETGEWGFTGDRNSFSLDGMVMGMAMDLTYRDSYGYPNMNINTNRNIEIGERLRSLFQTDASANCAEDARTLFASGKAMFLAQILVTAGKQLRSTTIDYMVIPMPLYDDTQEEYRIIPQDNYSSLSLLVHVNTALPAVTKTLEVMGSESYISLRHCIQEKCYKQRYLKTEPKGKMFDYIVDNMYYEFGYAYTKMIDHPVQLIRNYARYLPGEGGYIESLTSQLEATEVTSTELLEAFLERFFD